jgi:hypothetical protein
MKGHDKADLDGDGEFDVIDLMILEEGEPEKTNPPNKSGCCVLLMAVGTFVLTSSYAIASIFMR